MFRVMAACTAAVGALLVAQLGLASQAVAVNSGEPCSDVDALLFSPTQNMMLVCSGEGTWNGPAPDIAWQNARVTMGAPCTNEGAEGNSMDMYLVMCSGGTWMKYRV